MTVFLGVVLILAEPTGGGGVVFPQIVDKGVQLRFLN